MEANISANTLFHFTSTKQNLINILQNGIYARYSLENYESLIDDNLIGSGAEIAFPMACFCDIPLSQIKMHTKTYGKYAIGLTKRWGMENKINPVVYAYSKSSTADIMNVLLTNIQEIYDIRSNEIVNHKGQNDSLTKSIAIQGKLNPKNEYQPSFQIMKKIADLRTVARHFSKYVKPYEGKVFRNGEYLNEPVRFYNEKEWRYVPEQDFLEKNGIKDSLARKVAKNPVALRAANIKIAKLCKLNFSTNDIRFIVVNKDIEIPGILNELERIFEKRLSLYDYKLLGTRIISLEQVLDDL